jgi:orotidine-5'-phosphate decarboxylase
MASWMVAGRMARPSSLTPRDRLIVALDVPSTEEALAIVHELAGLVTFYKVGLELLMSGGMDVVMKTLTADGHRVFVDLKLPNDIPETVSRAVAVSARLGASFLTLSNSVTDATLRAAVKGRAPHSKPELLFVPFLSSQSRADFAKQYGRPESDFEAFLVERSLAARSAGADGFIVSGPEIAVLRKAHPDVVLVSPGIRPSGSKTDDHQRSCTPSEAVRLGADHIVVGRPIRDAADRRKTVQGILDELAGA